MGFKLDHIIYQFKISKEIAYENGSPFIGSKVTKFLEDVKIKRIYHSSANRQAESTNKVIIQNLKKKIETAKGKWPEEQQGVLWAYRTTAKLSTEETPFSLVYGTEDLILVKLWEPTLMFSRSNKEANNEAILVRMDLLYEHGVLACVRVVAQKQRMERYYNRRAKLCYFKVGDLILKKVTQSTREVNARYQEGEASLSRTFIASRGDAVGTGGEGATGVEGHKVASVKG
ncbi:uncharacterized protein LOC142163357 [Nicotiana tabacum]|uniref:Uncharacterized protein LOC142163357 n=1 Tax=Nicotiana tabacum TaxID=4097 RepID=A0AC58RVJ2_TOBAC